MSKGINNFPNMDTSDPTNYPNGQSKDNPGNNTGTPVNRLTLSDFQQFFAKLLRLAGITANNQFDNEGNGFQYLDAARAAFKRCGSFIGFDGSVSITVDGNLSPLVLIVAPASGVNTITLRQSSSPGVADFGNITIVNNSANSFNVLKTGTDTINGGAGPYAVAAGARVEFVLVKAFLQYVIVNEN